MKKIIALFALVTLIAGCAGNQINNDQAMQTTIKLAAFNVGFYVGKSKTVADDQAILAAYDLAITGQLSPAAINQGLVALKIDNPQLAGSAMILLTSMGGTITNGQVIDMVGIPPAAWTAAKDSYVMGQQMGLADQKK